MSNQVRVRFAPSPTGFMHLGNVRVALLNYLFAKKNNGAFIVRVEDTDFERNIDPQAKDIIEKLTWLNLHFNEGPEVGGPYAPYFQSQRTELYEQKLHELKNKNLVYRCFCTTEDLEKKRKRQIALKQPPRYDRTCFKLDEATINQKLEENVPFVWRLKTTQDKEISIADLAHGEIKFNLKDFSDFALTRADGSFTFTFANCIDDILMKISHVIRGEDHVTNSANQVVIYQSLNEPIPQFWHVPIIGNAEGKKLSKRDFGFSLHDLKKAGFLPEAICNYLGIIGGGSFEQEILSLNELVEAFNFEHMSATGIIKYDIEKLKWVNHKWIAHYTTEQLVEACLPFLTAFFPQATSLSPETLYKLIHAIKTDLTTLHDAPQLLTFYFEAPTLTKDDLYDVIPAEAANRALKIIQAQLHLLDDSDAFITTLKKKAKEQTMSLKEVFSTLRVLLTGSKEGLGIKELLHILGTQESKERLSKIAP